MKDNSNINWSQAPCIGCEDNCLGYEGFSSCIEYNGDDIPALGITCGMSMNEVISALASAFGAGTAINDITKGITSDDVSMTAKNSVSVSSTCFSSLPNKTFSYSLAPAASSTVFTYDVTSVSQNLPTGYGLTSFSVKLQGANSGINSNLYTSSSQSGTTNLMLSNFPVTATFSMQVSSPCGALVMSATAQLNNPAAAGTFNLVFALVGSSNSDSTIPTLTQTVERLEDEVAALKSAMA